MDPAKTADLLDAFQAAKAAGQEELWRETHPEVPDGPTVLCLWLLANNGEIDYEKLRLALKSVDDGCGVRMAIYAALVAYPIWAKYCKLFPRKLHGAPLAAIRAAIACYHKPMRKTQLACADASSALVNYFYNFDTERNCKRSVAAAHAATAAGEAADAASAAHAVARAGVGDEYAADYVAAYVYEAIGEAEFALNFDVKLVTSLVAAIADHYEGRPLEMP